MSAFLLPPVVAAVPWYTWVPAGAIIIVMLLVLLYQLVIKKWIEKRRKKKSEDVELEAPAPPPQQPPPNLDKGLIPRSFKLARRELRGRSARGSQYEIPWFLLTGRMDSGKSELISSLSDGPVCSPKLTRVGQKAGLQWAFLDGGVVMDVAGYYLTEDGDGASKRTGWGRVLARLGRLRKLRPVDGVVLTIPAADLITRGAGADAERMQWSRQVQERLQALQRRLGVRCPVYVVVTKTHELKGFEQFAQEIPDSFKHEMLGWSNPYSLDATYREDWLDEAYSSVFASLSEVQLAVMAREGNFPGREAFYLFRSQISATRDALSTMIAGLFKSTVYLESFFLRGVYFVGDPGGTEEAETEGPPPIPTAAGAAAEAGDSSDVRFARRLFETKIFPEAGLLRLGTRAVARRLKFKRAVQGVVIAALLILVTGIVMAGQKLSRATDALHPVLTAMRGEGPGAMADTQPSGPAGPSYRYSRTQTLRLLEDMGKLSYGQLRSAFLPSSYLSDIDARIQDAVTLGWERVIFPAFVAELDRRTREALQDPGLAATRIVPGAIIEQTPAMEELSKRLDTLQQVSTLAEQYRTLLASERRDLGDVNALAEALFGQALPAGFFRNYEYHEVALSRAQGPEFRPAGYQEMATTLTEKLFRSMFNSAFNADALIDELKRLATEAEQFRDMRVGPVPKTDLVSDMRQLSETISRVETQARRSRLPMLQGDNFAPGDILSRALADMNTLAFFPDKLAATMVELGQTIFEEKRDALHTAQVGKLGSVLERRMWASSFRLKPQILALRDALDAILSSEFGSVYPAASLRPITGDSSLEWKVDMLQGTQRLVDQYDSMRRDEFDTSPVEFQPLLKKIAYVLARAACRAKLADAQRMVEIIGEGTGDGNAEWQEQELANFKVAEPVLTPLIDTVKKAGFLETGQELEQILHRQAGELLTFADMALSAARPYEMVQPNFSWWDGEVSPALEAFGLTDPIELRPFVAMQRQTVSRLARDRAAPVLAVLEGKNLVDILQSADEAAQYEEVAVRWNKIIAALKAYKAKQPGNSVDALESLILNDMTKVTLENCFDPGLLRKFQVEPNEFFMERRERIRANLVARCRQLSAGRAYEEYAEIKLEMDRLIRDFPFNADSAYDADPAKVKRLLDRLKAFTKAHRETIDTSTAFRPESRRRVLAFLKQVEKVNEFFDTTFRIDGEIPSLSFDVGAAFRVNRNLEIGARQVIDWHLHLNRIEANLRTPETARYRWGLNDRVEVGFRWARDADHLPTERSNPPSTKVETGEISFTYSGPWSILRLVRAAAARSEMLEDNRDLNPQTLGFEIWTKKKDAPPDEQLHKAWLFVRVQLFSPTTKALLPVPDFPTIMPALERSY